MDHAMTTTTFDLTGYRVTRSLGVVRGIVVRYDATEIMSGVTEVLCYEAAATVQRA